MTLRWHDPRRRRSNMQAGSATHGIHPAIVCMYHAAAHATSRQARSPPQRWFLLDGDAAEESWLQLPAVRLDEVHLQLLQH